MINGFIFENELYLNRVILNHSFYNAYNLDDYFTPYGFMIPSGRGLTMLEFLKDLDQLPLYSSLRYSGAGLFTFLQEENKTATLYVDRANYEVWYDSIDRGALFMKDPNDSHFTAAFKWQLLNNRLTKQKLLAAISAKTFTANFAIYPLKDILAKQKELFPSVSKFPLIKDRSITYGSN